MSMAGEDTTVISLNLTSPLKRNRPAFRTGRISRRHMNCRCNWLRLISMLDVSYLIPAFPPFPKGPRKRTRPRKLTGSRTTPSLKSLYPKPPLRRSGPRQTINREATSVPNPEPLTHPPFRLPRMPACTRNPPRSILFSQNWPWLDLTENPEVSLIVGRKKSLPASFDARHDSGFCISWAALI